MPAILQDDQIEHWLDPTASDPHQTAELLKPHLKISLDCYPVSKEMSSGRVDDPRFADRIEADYVGLNPTPEILKKLFGRCSHEQPLGTTVAQPKVAAGSKKGLPATETED